MCLQVAAFLSEASTMLRDMQATLERMGERCDPYVYYHRVKLPMSGWKSSDVYPDGLVYEGGKNTDHVLTGANVTNAVDIPLIFSIVEGLLTCCGVWKKIPKVECIYVEM